MRRPSLDPADSANLGWNDMGDAVAPAVLREREGLEEQLRTAASDSGMDRRSAEKSKKAAFTLRLDTERHLRLRLASAMTRRSAQSLVIEALDAFLVTLPSLGTNPAGREE